MIKLETLKCGAFKIASQKNVPIIPMVFTYRTPTGLRKYIKKKPFITLTILKPIRPNDKLSKEEKERDIYLRTLKAMSEKMKGNSHEKY